jgi:hypothetical protein
VRLRNTMLLTEHGRLCDENADLNADHTCGRRRCSAITATTGRTTSGGRA